MDEILWEIFGLIYYFCYKSRYKQGETANSDYLLYTQIFGIFPQLVEKFKPLHTIAIDDSSLTLNIFAIPWGHHRTIIDYYEQEPEKALFYAMKTL